MYRGKNRRKRGVNKLRSKEGVSVRDTEEVTEINVLDLAILRVTDDKSIPVGRRIRSAEPMPKKCDGQTD